MSVQRLTFFTVVVGLILAIAPPASANGRAPGPVTGLHVTEPGVDSYFLTVAWDKVPRASYYLVTRTVNGRARAPIQDNSPSYTVGGPHKGATYSFTVSAANSSGDGPPATLTYTEPTTVPSLPGYVYGYSYGTDWAHIEWLPPADNGGLPITGYVVTPTLDYSSPAGSVPGPTTVGASTTGATITGLTSGSTYDILISAENSDGVGVQVDEYDVTLGPGVPGPVRDVQAHEIDYNTVRVTWVAPAVPVSSTGQAQPPVESYSVVGTDTGDVVRATVSGHRTSAVLHQVPSNGGYVFYVGASNVLGVSQDVDMSQQVGVDDPASAPVIDASAGNGSVLVRWGGPYDTGNGSNPGYFMVVSGGGRRFARPCRETSQRTFRRLTNGVAYTFTIATHQADGSLLESSATATPRVPTYLTGLRATRSGARVRVLAQLRRGDDKAVIARRVLRLEYRVAGTSGYRTWPTRVRTGAGGYARFTDFATRHRVSVRVVAPASGRYARSVSRSAPVAHG